MGGAYAKKCMSCYVVIPGIGAMNRNAPKALGDDSPPKLMLSSRWIGAPGPFWWKLCPHFVVACKPGQFMTRVELRGATGGVALDLPA